MGLLPTGRLYHKKRKTICLLLAARRENPQKPQNFFQTSCTECPWNGINFMAWGHPMERGHPIERGHPMDWKQGSAPRGDRAPGSPQFPCFGVPLTACLELSSKQYPNLGCCLLAVLYPGLFPSCQGVLGEIQGTAQHPKSHKWPPALSLTREASGTSVFVERSLL